MSIWTCKQGLLAFACALILSACGTVPSDELAAFPSLGGETDAPEERRTDVSLKQTDLAGGALTLVPPDGFCIDKRGLKDNFAVVARCDALGGSDGAFDTSLGIILVSVAPVSENANVEQLLLASFDDDVQVQELFGLEPLALAHLKGGAPKGVDPVYWKGLSSVNGHLISLSAFALKGGSFATEEGGRVLIALATRMANASQTRTARSTVVADNPRTGGGLGNRISGLFNRKAFIE